MRPFKVSLLATVWLCTLIRARTVPPMCSSCTLQIYFKNIQPAPCNDILLPQMEEKDLGSLKVIWNEANPALQYLVVMSLEHYDSYNCPPVTPRSYYFISTATSEVNRSLEFSNTPIVEFMEDGYLNPIEDYYIYVTLFPLSNLPDGATREQVRKLAQKANNFDRVLAPLGISKPFDVVKAWHRFRFAIDTTLFEKITYPERTTTPPKKQEQVLVKAAIKSGSVRNIPGSCAVRLCGIPVFIFTVWY